MKTTKIEWCDHTWSPWWGCAKVSEGCRFCYAETWDRRIHGTSKHVTAKGETREPHWGKDAPRRFFGDAHWREPIAWNRDAEKAGVRKRVFCASMADVFEDRPDLRDPRLRLFALIDETPHLDWLLLTKRPENMIRLATERWFTGWPSNVWAGTTCEDQQRADERIPHLLAVPAAVRFLSVEPMLGPVHLWSECFRRNDGTPAVKAHLEGLHWVIVGGESGHGRRELDPAWADDVVAQCEAVGVAVFVKQDSGPKPGEQGRLSPATWAHKEFPR